MSAKEKSAAPAAKAKMCKLVKDGREDLIAQVTLRPTVFCNKCKAKADNPSILCNPRALKKRAGCGEERTA